MVIRGGQQKRKWWLTKVKRARELTVDFGRNPVQGEAGRQLALLSRQSFVDALRWSLAHRPNHRLAKSMQLAETDRGLHLQADPSAARFQRRSPAWRIHRLPTTGIGRPMPHQRLWNP